MARPFQAAEGERRGYQAAGLTIPRVESAVTVKNSKVEGERATVTADVQTTVHLAGVAGAPEKTVEVMPHVYTYEKRNGRWELVEDAVTDPFQMSVPDTFPRAPGLDRSPSSLDKAAPRNQPNRGNAGGNPPSGSLFHRASYNPDVPFGTAFRGSLDPARVVSYARSYALTYNSSYRDFNNSGTQGGDCTNFASQAVRYGGWPDVGGYTNRTTTAAWWYDFITQTYTWVNAHYFYLYTKAYRGDPAPNVYDLAPGDILQMDLNADGDVDHTTVVTKKDANGMIYLSYHTSNSLDKPFTTFQSQVSTSTRYYAWWLRYYF